MWYLSCFCVVLGTTLMPGKGAPTNELQKCYSLQPSICQGEEGFIMVWTSRSQVKKVRIMLLLMRFKATGKQNQQC